MSRTPLKPPVTGYAVEMYFDSADEQRVCDLIDQLSSRGIRSSLPAAARPHVSLAVFDRVDVERMSAALREFARDCPALRLCLASIGRFPTDEGVVFLAPVVTSELLELHAKLHRLAPVVAGARRDALPLAAAELVREAVHVLGRQSHRRQQLAHPLAARLAAADVVHHQRVNDPKHPYTLGLLNSTRGWRRWCG